MINENQLRVALSDRADEARPELERAELAIGRELSRAQAATGPRHRRMLTGWAAAAAVAALVIIPVTVGQRTATPSSTPPPPSSGPVLAPTTSTRHSTADPTTTAHTTTHVTTTDVTTPPASPGTVRTSTIVNAIGVGIDRSIDWDLRTDVEYVTVQMPDDLHASVAAFAPGVGFNASRVAAAQPVTVAGKPGWYGNVSVWPTNGRPDPASGKQNGAVPSVAWQMGSTWVVVQSDDSRIVDPTELAALAGSLQISDRPPVLRLPFTVAYVPTNLTVHSVEYYQPVGDDPQPPTWQLSLGAGSISVDFALGFDDLSVDTPGTMTPEPTKSSTRPGRLQISGKGVTGEQLGQVRRSAVTTVDPAGSQQGWPTLEDALP